MIFGIGISTVFAQETVVTSGGDASGSGGSVSYSVGQVLYTSNSGTNGSVAQGVQQPYEISIVTGITENGISLLSAYPNPTSNFLTLQINDYVNKQLVYQLFDINGKLIESKQISSNQTILVMEHLAVASYLLKVSQNNKEIKTFKIIRN